ncbi:hypothetical protein FS749_007050 [Ceratobasidium sp. UAMH 11750]|nr:hypothetical protein FS749_007050 [Ceratobasidium sp. UAMH 11750]
MQWNIDLVSDALEAIAALALGDELTQSELYKEQVASRVISLMKDEKLVIVGLKALAALAADENNAKYSKQDEFVDLLKQFLSSHDPTRIAHTVHVIAALTENPTSDPSTNSAQGKPYQAVISDHLASKGLITSLLSSRSRMPTGQDEVIEIPISRRLSIKGMYIPPEELFDYDFMSVVASFVVDEKSRVEMIQADTVPQIVSLMKGKAEGTARKAICALVHFASHDDAHEKLEQEQSIEQLVDLLRNDALICDALDGIASLAHSERIRRELLKHDTATKVINILQLRQGSKRSSEPRPASTGELPMTFYKTVETVVALADYPDMREKMLDSGLLNKLLQLTEAPEMGQNGRITESAQEEGSGERSPVASVDHETVERIVQVLFCLWRLKVHEGLPKKLLDEGSKIQELQKFINLYPRDFPEIARHIMCSIDQLIKQEKTGEQVEQNNQNQQGLMQWIMPRISGLIDSRQNDQNLFDLIEAAVRKGIESSRGPGRRPMADLRSIAEGLGALSNRGIPRGNGMASTSDLASLRGDPAGDDIGSRYGTRQKNWCYICCDELPPTSRLEDLLRDRQSYYRDDPLPRPFYEDRQANHCPDCRKELPPASWLEYIRRNRCPFCKEKISDNSIQEERRCEENCGKQFPPPPALADIRRDRCPFCRETLPPRLWLKEGPRNCCFDCEDEYLRQRLDRR